jgi:hypothetical protein
MRRLSFLVVFSLSPIFAAAPKLAVDSQNVAAGELIVSVRNLADVPVMAFLVGTSDTKYVTVDALLGARNGRPLPPGETAEARLPNPEAGEAKVMAAIFEDGTIAGDAHSEHLLLAPRVEAYYALPQAFAMLRLAATQDVSASTAASWFHQWQERWRASDPNRGTTVQLTAEVFLSQRGAEPAAAPARELIQAFEELSAKLAKSRPEL